MVDSQGILKRIDQNRLGIEEIQKADSVDSAMHLFLEMHPQLVISDVWFPVEDGVSGTNRCMK